MEWIGNTPFTDVRSHSFYFLLVSRFIRDKYERRKYFDAAILHRIVTLGDDSSLGTTAKDEQLTETVSTGTAVRLPSEAAKLRAENRRGRLNHSASSSSSLSDSYSSKPTIVQIPPKNAPPPAPIIDLLDFSSLPSSPADLGPPPLPPSLQASPNLDLFKTLQVNENTLLSSTTAHTTGDAPDIFGDIYNRKTALSATASNPFPSQEEKKKTLTSTEILAMFNPSPVSNAPFHTSTSAPNFVAGTTQSKFDFFNSMSANNHNTGPSSLVLTPNPLQTQHSFPFPSAFQSGIQNVTTTTSHVGGISNPTLSYPTSTFNINDASTFSMTNNLQQPNMGTSMLSGMPIQPQSMGGMSFGAAMPFQQNFISSQPPPNVPPPPPLLASISTNLGMPNTQQMPSYSMTRGLDVGNHEFQIPMGGAAGGHFSVMGGVESNPASFSVMGGSYNDTNGLDKNSSATNNLSTLNSFR